MQASPGGDEVCVVTQVTGQASPVFIAQSTGSNIALAPIQGVNILVIGFDIGFVE